MPVPTLEQIEKCNRCGATVTWRYTGSQWLDDQAPTRWLKVETLEGPAEGLAPERTNAILCPECSEAFGKLMQGDEVPAT